MEDSLCFLSVAGAGTPLFTECEGQGTHFPLEVSTPLFYSLSISCFVFLYRCLFLSISSDLPPLPSPPLSEYCEFFTREFWGAVQVHTSLAGCVAAYAMIQVKLVWRATFVDTSGVAGSTQRPLFVGKTFEVPVRGRTLSNPVPFVCAFRRICGAISRRLFTCPRLAFTAQLRCGPPSIHPGGPATILH